MYKWLSVLGALLLTASITMAGISDPGGGSGGTPLTVKENDDDPTVTSVNTISFTNGTVVDSGGGVATVTISGTGAPTDATYITQTADGTLSNEQALGALATGCMGSATTTGIISTRTLVGTANQISITNTVCEGNPVFSIPTNPTLPGTTTGTFSGNLTGNVTGSATSLAANGANCSAGSAAGGVDASGAAEDCTNYAEEPGSNGILARTAANTFSARTITGTSEQISVANGDGASGNPTISLPSVINLSAKTLRIPNGTVLPGTCTVGDQFMDTDATLGEQLYLCTSTDTFTLQGDGGGGGAGTVTSVDATGGVETASGSAITTSGTIRGAIDQRVDTGTTDTVLTGDRGKLVTWSDANPVAVTLPQAGTGFEDKWWFIAKNVGVGTVTITPITSTIDGTTEITLTTGQFTIIVSDGTNYTSTGVALLAEADTFESVKTRGAEVTTANSEANAVIIGNGTNKWKIYNDVSDGLQFVCFITTLNNCDYFRSLAAGKKFGVKDSGGVEIFTISEATGAMTNASISLASNTLTGTTAEFNTALSDGSFATLAGTEVLTNKTIDAEATGNVITTVSKVNWATVGCSGTTGTLLLDTNATLAPTATCTAGSTNTTLIQGYADFPDSDGDYSLQIPVFKIPSDYTSAGGVDLEIKWKSAATTGAVVWQVATMCTTDNEIEDVAWNTADAFAADTAQGTTLRINTTSKTGINMTNCSANDLMHMKVFRNRTHASDDIAGVISLKSFELTMRRAQ